MSKKSVLPHRKDCCREDPEKLFAEICVYRKSMHLRLRRWMLDSVYLSEAGFK